MGVHLALWTFLLLSLGRMFAEGRILEVSEATVSAQNEKLCTLCEEFTAQAVVYLSQNKTQQEIIDNLHQACSGLQSFKQQCVLLVDYYAPLFFLEVATINPEDFCKKVNLCEKWTLVSLPLPDNTCTICQNAIAEVRTKLQDPETQLDIIEALLKACNKVEQYTQQCKKLIFEYGPVILINAEKFLEKTDICTALHVCKADDNQNGLPAFVVEATAA